MSVCINDTIICIMKFMLIRLIHNFIKGYVVICHYIVLFARSRPNSGISAIFLVATFLNQT